MAEFWNVGGIKTALVLLAAVLPLGCLGQDIVAPTLKPGQPGANGWFRLRGDGGTNQVFTLQASVDLLDWRTVAVLHDAPFEFADAAAPARAARFYRLSARSRGFCGFRAAVMLEGYL